jgi:uncharacterized cupredoxin-like copper-binding protein
MRARAIAVVSFCIATGGIVFPGCGGDDGNDSAKPTTTQQSGGSAPVIRMDDYSFSPKDATATAGRVKITAPNDGKVVHELVLLKTNRDPGSFEVSGGEVDEKALEESGAKIPGEIADVPPGKSKTMTVDLTPGNYVMICNLPGHYQRGMYGSLTAK